MSVEQWGAIGAVGAVLVVILTLVLRQGSAFRSELGKFRAEMLDDNKRLRAEVNGSMDGLRVELRDEIADLRTEVRDGIERQGERIEILDSRVYGLAVRLAPQLGPGHEVEAAS